MSNNKNYRAVDVCNELGISIWTLTNWYSWEAKRIKAGLVEKNYLPKPIRLVNEKGKPRVWTEDMLNALREYKNSIVIGRNGVYGIYSNPNHKDTMKYKKSEETLAKK